LNEARNVLIGYEFNRERSQICYWDRKAAEPISIPTKVGTNLFTFPTALCRAEGKPDWHFGLEAEYFGSQPGGIFLDKLYDICLGTQETAVGSAMMRPDELLAVFLRESLAMLGLRDVTKSIAAIMVTTDTMSKTMVENFKKAFESLGFRKDQYSLQDSDESFFYYCFMQKPEIWSRKIALFIFSGNEVVFSEMNQDRTTRPAVVSITHGEKCILPEIANERDLAFLEYATKNIRNQMFSGIFITGIGFEKDWATRSVPYLCRSNRHVYCGGNLYVKGACYAALERKETHDLKGCLYIGRDLVRTNLGMEMLIGGNPAYYPLIAAGVNWYEAEKDCEFILDDRKDLVFAVNSMDGQKKKFYRMELPGLPERPNRTTRIRLHAECTSPEACTIDAEDLGFGGMFEASHKKWHEEMEL
jgi:hypothetical protein